MIGAKKNVAINISSHIEGDRLDLRRLAFEKCPQTTASTSGKSNAVGEVRHVQFFRKVKFDSPVLRGTDGLGCLHGCCYLDHIDEALAIINYYKAITRISNTKFVYARKYQTSSIKFERIVNKNLCFQSLRVQTGGASMPNSSSNYRVPCSQFVETEHDVIFAICSFVCSR